MVNGILKKIFIVSILTIVFSTGFFNVREVDAAEIREGAPASSIEDQRIAAEKRLEYELELENK